jgi:S-phase kinase-associated protein 1
MSSFELTTIDNKTYNLNIKFKDYSKFLGGIAEESDPTDVITGPVSIESAQFDKIIEFYQIYERIPKYEIPRPLDYTKKFEEQIPYEMYKFVSELTLDELVPLINGCNYLNTIECLELCCAYMAVLIEGKSPEEIRQIFNIEDDLTAEDKEKIKEELSVFDI